MSRLNLSRLPFLPLEKSVAETSPTGQWPVGPFTLEEIYCLWFQLRGTTLTSWSAAWTLSGTYFDYIDSEEATLTRSGSFNVASAEEILTQEEEAWLAVKKVFQTGAATPQGWYAQYNFGLEALEFIGEHMTGSLAVGDPWAETYNSYTGQINRRGIDSAGETLITDFFVKRAGTEDFYTNQHIISWGFTTGSEIFLDGAFPAVLINVSLFRKSSETLIPEDPWPDGFFGYVRTDIGQVGTLKLVFPNSEKEFPLWGYTEMTSQRVDLAEPTAASGTCTCNAVIDFTKFYPHAGAYDADTGAYLLT